MPKRQETLYKDFSGRLQPRPIWSSMNGTAIRIDGRYVAMQQPAPKVKRQLTEAEDNAIGRAIRRRLNRKLRNGGRRIPFAQR